MEVFKQQEILAAVHHAADLHGGGPGSALQVCQSVQAHFSCVPPAAVPLIAHALGTTTGHIVSLVSFYSFLHETPRGQFDIYLSDNITDRMGGSQQLLDMLCQGLGVVPGEPRLDGRVTVSTTSCTGLCDQGPGGLVNGRPLVRLDAARIDHIQELVESDTPLDEWPRDYFAVQSNIQRRDKLLSSSLAEGGVLSQLEEQGAEHMLQQLESSGLTGRGGAGFPTATKWRMCRDTPAAERYVVCNADEGEPGTFKDRVLLTEHTDEIVEGMTLCARIVGAEKGFIYLRAEYAFLAPHLEWVLQRRRVDGLLGQAILGQPDWHFEIDVHLGAGAYICGEESALIESLEGKRGTPRNRPPYPVTRGFRNQPTVVNNVETLFASAHICAKGGDWFGAGTKLHSISGDCERPGIYEFPVGTSIAEMLSASGAADARAVQVAGAAGHLFLPEEFDTCIDLKTLTTSGSFMVFGPGRELFDVAANFTRFFARETCGFCAPCRTGTQLARSVVDRMEHGNAFGRDRQAVDRLINVTPVLSHCGLGGSALNSLQDLRDKCPEYYQGLFSKEADEVLHFDLERELSEIKTITGTVHDD